MKRRAFCIAGIGGLHLAGCGVTECGLLPSPYIRIYIRNKTASGIYGALNGVGNAPQGSSSGDFLQLGEEATSCSGIPKPPSASSIDTSVFLLYKSGTTPEHGRLFFGGPLAEYEMFVAQNPTAFFAKTTLHAHSLFFVPGSQVRQDMGLVVNNPTGTEIFTSLDPWRPYKFAGFTLNIDVYDLDAGDIRMSVTGTLAN